MSDSYIIKNTKFIVMIDDSLTDFKRKVLTYLYMPIVGINAINLYSTFSTLIASDTRESDLIDHERFIKKLQIKNDQEFLQAREQLEALRLLESYFNGSIYLYALKSPLLPQAFFNDNALSQLLLSQIGSKEYERTVFEFAIRTVDINNFKKITKTFDEVFTLSTDFYNENYQQLFIDTDSGTIEVRNEQFDYQLFQILISAQEILNNQTLVSKEFYQLINRYSFFYQLTAEELKDAVLLATNVDKVIDYQLLEEAVKKVYSNKNQHIKLVAKKHSSSGVDASALVRQLESLSPNDLVTHYFGESLVASEIAMFDQLQRETSLHLGIINTLIIYIVSEKDGQIPPYNYFLKVAKSWKRQAIKTTQEALDYINGRTPKNTNRPNRNAKNVPDWYNEYINEIEQKKIAPQEKTSSDNQRVISIEEFFKDDD